MALFGAFSVATLAYAATRSTALGAAAAVAGCAGVYSSGRLYLVPARPVWNSPRTILAFFATAVATGPLLAVLATGPSPGARFAFGLAGAGTLLQLALIQHLVASFAVRREREFALTSRLLFRRFRPLFVARVVLALAALSVCAATWLSVGVAPGRPLGVGAGLLIRPRRGVRLVEASWEQAIGRLVGGFRDLVERHGPDSIAIISTGQLVTEEFYALGKPSNGTPVRKRVASESSRRTTSNARCDWTGSRRFEDSVDRHPALASTYGRVAVRRVPRPVPAQPPRRTCR